MSTSAPQQSVHEFDPNDPFFSVSVIIPFYKGERFIEDTVRSILSQTVKPVELIIIDHESPNPLALSAEVAEQVTVIRRPNHSASAFRNFGAAMAKGRWPAFCDQDDIWVSTKLEKQLSLVSEVPELHFVLTDYVTMSDDVLDARSHLSIAQNYPQAQPYRAELLAGFGEVRQEIRECERYARRRKLKRLLGIRQ